MSVFRTKKSASKIAIIGAKTEPMKYKNPSMFCSGKKQAARIPTTVTIIAFIFSFILREIVFEEIPAENASKNVVVTVENIMINNPIMPIPICNIIAEGLFLV